MCGGPPLCEQQTPDFAPTVGNKSASGVSDRSTLSATMRHYVHMPHVLLFNCLQMFQSHQQFLHFRCPRRREKRSLPFHPSLSSSLLLFRTPQILLAPRQLGLGHSAVGTRSVMYALGIKSRKIPSAFFRRSAAAAAPRLPRPSPLASQPESAGPSLGPSVVHRAIVVCNQRSRMVESKRQSEWH